MRIFLAVIIFGFSTISCQQKSQNESEPAEKAEIQDDSTKKTLGSVEILDPALNNFIPENAEIEILADGFDWTEGPVWVPSLNALLFSDIPQNKIYKWNEKEGLQDYLQPSGYSGNQDYSDEPGSNGLLIDSQQNLVLCQHGNRQLAMMEAPLNNPTSTFKPIASNFEGKKFNSPNDVVLMSNGNFYFTDPIYGLKEKAEDPSRELDFCGVYKVNSEGKVTLLTKELSRPNGIGFSPDEKTLYVANSDPENPIWMAFNLNNDGAPEKARVFYDATEESKKAEGMPDGLTVHKSGNLFATGPGGVWIITPEGKHIGTIKTGVATANCTFNEDQSVLYITADMYLLRIKLNSANS